MTGIIPAAYENAARLVSRTIELFPRHKGFLERRFAHADAAELAACDRLAHDVIRLAGERFDDFIAGYEFICKIQTEEELWFRRNKGYRLTTFAEALEQVYANRPYMLAYMRGLLVTQVFWSNHTRSIRFYEDRFISSLDPDTDLLEIGPGHGLLLARAIEALEDGRVTGWDISEASLEDTRAALKALGVTKSSAVKARNLFDKGEEKFGAIVFSEVLEHLETPKDAMTSIRGFLKPGGRLYVNVPVNSPAPDHLFLLRSPEEAVSFLEECGFKVLETGFYPATNYTMEQARKHALTISVCVIATPA